MRLKQGVEKEWPELRNPEVVVFHHDDHILHMRALSARASACPAAPPPGAPLLFVALLSHVQSALFSHARFFLEHEQNNEPLGPLTFTVRGIKARVKRTLIEYRFIKAVLMIFPASGTIMRFSSKDKSCAANFSNPRPAASLEQKRSFNEDSRYAAAAANQSWRGAVAGLCEFCTSWRCSAESKEELSDMQMPRRGHIARKINGKKKFSGDDHEPDVASQ
ncbi:hypothetical protein EVAR_11602_1 [Eumeta japonica]|uniref:Uncharacterized protein n=1 Tax=Eumeta variegata TaxID=151549 RepID=A0A4C1X613_EUMVA|nr:hypothetical protein EVAR_11602_1 [Eumeta japonica]